MDEQVLKTRTKQFGLRVLTLVDALPNTTAGRAIGNQSAFWLELIVEGGLLKPELVSPLREEAEELTAIFTASGRTAKANNPRSTIRNHKC